MSETTGEQNGSATSAADPAVPNNEEEVERGLRFAHIMMMVGQSQGNEAIGAVMALSDLLVKKGVLDPDELTTARAQAREQIAQMAQPRVRLADLGDKYAEEETVEIDCAARIHLCHARCCTFNFYLTGQDLEEGVARWDYGNPYWIRRRSDGYCVHCSPENRGCTIHAQRPHVCRLYDCREDKRIWIDFEKRIPAPLDDPTGVNPIALAEPDLSRRLTSPGPHPKSEESANEPPASAGGDRK